MFRRSTFVPPPDVIDAFDTLCDDDDDLPQHLISYFELHYVGGQRGRWSNRRGVAPTYQLEVWNLYDRILNKVPVTNNCVEGYHNALQSSITNTHPNPNLWKLIDGLKKEECLGKKKMMDLERGDRPHRKNKYKDIHKSICITVRSYATGQVMSYLRTISMNMHSF